VKLTYPTFTVTDATRCDACGAEVKGAGWQPKAAHVDWHIANLQLLAERVRAKTEREDEDE
jgi:ribosomal protein L37AE/L43A